MEPPFDIHLLQVLFLIRYVEEIKPNVDNLVTLCLDEIDADRLALRRKIEESLLRLEKETLISRGGDLYSFLTNEERDINREIKNIDILGGEDSKLLGELIFSDLLKDQRKYRYPVNKMDFDFNRVCDSFPQGNRLDGALLVSVVTPLSDEYELYENSRCILDSGGEGGQALIKLSNDERLGRELRVYVQTQKYLRRDDGALPESAKRIRANIATDNQTRRGRLIELLKELLTAADCFVAGQPLKLKSATPAEALNEALEYLVRNSSTKMGYLKLLTPEADRPKAIQAILRSNDIGQQTLALTLPEGNKEALDDLRNYIQLSASANRPIVLHELLEKCYALRPYGWPDNEVLILLARLLVLGEINLMMDGALIPLEKVYEAITTPAKRRKITVLKRQTADPKTVQNARNLGKDLFHEMGPESEDGLFSFLRAHLRPWQLALERFKPLADTGNYPGRDSIDAGLKLSGKLAPLDGSFKFIEQFNARKEDLLTLAEDFHDLQHFYENQKPVWEKLRKAFDRFHLNRTELERNDQAAPALRRMQEILNAPSPYGLIREVDALITTASGINNTLVTERQRQAGGKIDGHLAALTNDLTAAQADAAFRAACLRPLEALRGQIETQESLAHLAQAETEALRAYDAAVLWLEEFVKKASQVEAARELAPETSKPVLKKQRIVEPAKLVNAVYLETQEQVESFLADLRRELEEALESNERIQIR